MTKRLAIRSRRLAVALTVAGLVGLATAGAAIAASRHHGHHDPRPYRPLHAGLSLPASVEANQPISFSYRLANLPGHDRLYLQHPVGTAHYWRDLARLTPSAHGIAQTTGLPMGTFRYRLAITAGKQTIWAGHPVSVRSYVNVPLDRLVPSAEPGSVVIGSNTFNYVFIVHSDEDIAGTTFQVLGSHDTNCRYLALEIGYADAFFSTNLYWVAVLTQQTQTPVSVTIWPEQVVPLAASLIPGQSWSLGLTLEKSTPADYEGGANIYLNGYANCDTDSALS